MNTRNSSDSDISNLSRFWAWDNLTILWQGLLGKVKKLVLQVRELPDCWVGLGGGSVAGQQPRPGASQSWRGGLPCGGHWTEAASSGGCDPVLF